MTRKWIALTIAPYSCRKDKVEISFIGSTLDGPPGFLYLSISEEGGKEASVALTQEQAREVADYILIGLGE